jgi:hypothetical protein
MMECSPAASQRLEETPHLTKASLPRKRVELLLLLLKPSARKALMKALIMVHTLPKVPTLPKPRRR